MARITAVSVDRTVVLPPQSGLFFLRDRPCQEERRIRR